MSEIEIYSPNSEKEGDFQVTFNTLEDPEDVLRLSHAHKWFIVILVCTTTLCVTSISSVWSLASELIKTEFGVSHEMSTLGISLYTWCLGTGSIFLSPISEFHGRKIVYVSGLFVVFAFQFVPAFSANFGFIIFSRAIAGFFASSFLSVASGTFSDLFKKSKRTMHLKHNQDKELSKALVVYSSSCFVGPALGPLISGLICQNISYRWQFRVMCIWSGLMTILVLIFVPETYEPILLKRKAKRLRKTTGDQRYYAAIEIHHISLYESILMSSKRPILLLLNDRVTVVLCFYSGFILGIIYMFFVSFPHIMQTVYNFNLQAQGLSFLGLLLGLSSCALISPGLVNIWRSKIITKNGGVHTPELRFLPVMVGVFFVPVGLFIIAWTSYSKFHWIGPIFGSFVYGIGTILIFDGIFAYTVEAYRKYTASAMATNSFVRSIMCGVFPLIGIRMYEAMGIHWATTLVAFFGCLLIPIPFLLYKYGAIYRSKSPYTWFED
ncbi:hypothetical protein JCM33374_g3021 [Metschnikowia sp. JCM 33374]|nr:hypothetical protein JCM33374_g3021 [Metschnikowia sp. JCM 33374]